MPYVPVLQVTGVANRSHTRSSCTEFHHFARVDLHNYGTQKFPTLDQNIILKSLVYFDDITDSSIKYITGNEISIEEIKKTLENTVRALGQ